MDPSRYLPRPLPEQLKGLAELALDLRWNASHAADELWRYIDADLWESVRDPWMMLESITDERLDELHHDTRFISRLSEQLAIRRRYLEQPGWFPQTHDADRLNGIAYFSMEFGLNESLPIYSGGLGILAGDYLKAASDLAVPVVGVGLLYQQGYFRQSFDQDGRQLAFFPYNNPTMLPVVPVRDGDGGWLRICIELPGRTLHLRAWRARVGRSDLYLLDTNDLRNRPGDRSITSELYGGGAELRLQQELVLGIGGWRMLRAIGMHCDVCHLNEGHAAFAVLERARSLMQDEHVPFDIALQASRPGNLFTTHTPVEAGFDRYSPELVQQYLAGYCGELGIAMNDLLALGRSGANDGHEPFNMAYLAARGSIATNGVSRLHGAVSRYIFQPLFPRWPHAEVPVDYVTNGVHVPSWDSAAADALWTKACEERRWLGTLDDIERDLKQVSDEELWQMRGASRAAMVQAIRARVQRQRTARGSDHVCRHLLDPNVLTLGFARRFAGYKRPTLLLFDEERLLRLLTNPDHPVQLVLAGKAHPADADGQQMVQRWNLFLRRPEVHNRVVFVEDYDLSLAAELTQGVDVWLNTPRRPHEASGTSGMKAAANGALNVSVLDGWWAEAWADHGAKVGWAVGRGEEYEDDEGDRIEADLLYDVLEREVIPLFFDRDRATGLPREWIARMKASISCLVPDFNTSRMVREYTERTYVPAIARATQIASSDGLRSIEDLVAWKQRVRAGWASVAVGDVEIAPTSAAPPRTSPEVRVGELVEVAAQVRLGELRPEDVVVELYYGPTMGSHELAAGSIARMRVSSSNPDGTHTFLGGIPTLESGSHAFATRVMPWNPLMSHPYETSLVRWA